MRSGVIAALLALAPAAASAQAMNAEQFYRRATALQDKGMLAVFSRGEIKSLMGEVQVAAKLAAEMSNPKIAADFSRVNELGASQRELEDKIKSLYSEWDEAANQLE